MELKIGEIKKSGLATAQIEKQISDLIKLGYGIERLSKELCISKKMVMKHLKFYSLKTQNKEFLFYYTK